MTNPSGEKARDYREGFFEGVQATIKAIGDDLPEEQMRVLERWATGPLRDWLDAPADAKVPPFPMIDGA